MGEVADAAATENRSYGVAVSWVFESLCSMSAFVWWSLLDACPTVSKLRRSSVEHLETGEHANCVLRKVGAPGAGAHPNELGG